MNPTDITKAIAELDGWRIQNHHNLVCSFACDMRNAANWHKAPDYLNSRDAIVPVIEKQEIIVRNKNAEIIQHQSRTPYWPSISCYYEALLRATGKWVE